MARSLVECPEIHRDIAIFLPHGIAMATNVFFLPLPWCTMKAHGNAMACHGDPWLCHGGAMAMSWRFVTTPWRAVKVNGNAIGDHGDAMVAHGNTMEKPSDVDLVFNHADAIVCAVASAAMAVCEGNAMAMPCQCYGQPWCASIHGIAMACHDIPWHGHGSPSHCQGITMASMLRHAMTIPRHAMNTSDDVGPGGPTPHRTRFLFCFLFFRQMSYFGK